MPARSRLRRVGGGTGSVLSVLSSTVTASRDWTAIRSSCIDTSPGHNLAFEADHQWTEGHIADLHYVPDPQKPNEFTQCVGYPLGYWATAGNGVPAHQNIPGQPSNSFLAVQLVAATNPSRPVVDLPVAFLELRELPSLLKTVGDTLIKTWAKKNLSREFGLTPMLDDALKLMKFSSLVAKRVEMFKALRERPLLRKATLWSGSLYSEPGNLVQTNSSPTRVQTIHKRISINTSVVIGGYVTWTPEPVFDKSNLAYADPALEFLARRAVLGTSIDAYTLWNAVPWTWLADWFGNMGDWLSANRSLVPALPSSPRLTIQSRTTESWVISSSNVGLLPGMMPVTTNHVTKKRVLASAALPSAYMPLFTGRQVNILASLAALRYT